jgi:hypothetical protein
VTRPRGRVAGSGDERERERQRQHARRVDEALQLVRDDAAWTGQAAR